MEPLELLYEDPELPAFDLPAELQDFYRGSLGFQEPCLYTNFVSTVDGVVAIPSLVQSSRLISGDSESDRFVMGLLRACADVVLTTEQGAAILRGRLPASSTLIALGTGNEVDPRAAVDALHARGHRLILSEAGPHVFGSLLELGLVDELFLTLSPLLGGRLAAGERLALVEGTEFLPTERVAGRLASARRQRAHLFLRYRIEKTEEVRTER